MARFTRHRLVAASPDVAWARVATLTAFLADRDAVPEVDVVTAEPGRTVSTWAVRLRGSRMSWTQEERVVEPERAVRFQLVAGDPRILEGEWRVVIGEDGTAVELDAEFEFGIPTLSTLVNPAFGRSIDDLMTLAVARLECGPG
jgi:ribosome-associated toxin RatA of RatAB toxin-antitoxin module